jgi:hypothetical protein
VLELIKHALGSAFVLWAATNMKHGNLIAAHLMKDDVINLQFNVFLNVQGPSYAWWNSEFGLSFETKRLIRELLGIWQVGCKRYN